MDKPVSGAAAGLVSGMTVGIISMALYMFGICNLCLVAIGGGLFNRAIVPPVLSVQNIAGWAAHLTLGMILGILFIYILYFTGRDFALLKGALFGTAVWYVAIGLVLPVSGMIPGNANTADIMILLAYHLLFGLLTAALLVRYAKLETIKR
ncbi:MAG: hypothetical protein SCK29_04895 [Bacillota bacterium]|nr:hypothetical protein [Bacillota bacterium]MDW7683442.1 hypothetical protein [Bacillota bacterium]